MLDWPLREVFLAFENHIMHRADKAYQHAQLIYVLQAPHIDKRKAPGFKMPAMPSILKEPEEHGQQA